MKRTVFLWALAVGLAFSQAYYFVEPKDTLSSIAAKTGVSQKQLVQLNAGVDLRPRKALILPMPTQLSYYVAILQPGAKVADPVSGKVFPVLPYLQLDPLQWEGTRIRLRHISGSEFLTSRSSVVLVFSTPSYGQYLQMPFFNFLLKFYGAPYRYGGESFRTGIDCSSYVKTAFATVGLGLPRVSADQFRTGYPVRSDQLLGGDLVFFAKTIQRVSHVGIYWGSMKFIHASIRGVKFSSLWEKYYLRHFVGARRHL